MMKIAINFLIVLKTIGRPLNYEDLDFEILHVWMLTEGSKITNLRPSRKSVSHIWRKFDDTKSQMKYRHHDFWRNLMISFKLWKSMTWKIINFLKKFWKNFLKKVLIFCRIFFPKPQNHQLKPFLQPWKNSRNFLKKVEFFGPIFLQNVKITS